MNVNISDEFNFSEVHGGMNCSGSLSKFIKTLRGLFHFARDQLRFISPQAFDILSAF